ncbi:hypothetical protein PR202_gb01869 [Eleusine coracana subsp. coracana]|uniref:Tyrosine specific protein phosphatases domain-containing protein n=1 Tax=Eleusine coracana subsp. coracana TaxID=191504 RepID=A0AAV5DXC5_ELECO|nr:hypothetical protein PR202_gb01869 [Eleusine coracana subsp. coracana]
MRIRELRDGAGGLEEAEDDEREEPAGGGEVVAVVRLRAKRALVGAGARVLFYPTLLYNVLRNRFEAEFRWWDRVDQAHGINHLEIPTRDYLFAPSLEDVCRAVDFIHRNEMQGGSTYVHCKAGRGRSTTIKYRNMTPEAALDHARSAVKLFSTLTASCLPIQSSNQTCSVQSGKESSESSRSVITRCLSLPIQSSNEHSSVTSDEESSEASFGDLETDGYASEFDTEHFVLPRCRSMLKLEALRLIS